MQTPGLMSLALSVGFGGIFVIALWLLPAELAGQRQVGRGATSIYLQALGSVPEFAAARSWRVQQAQLTGCDDLLAGPSAKIADPQAMHRVAAACLKRAKQILRSSPTAAIAHLIRAQALERMASAEQAEAAFLLAQKTAPYEGWLAARRLRFVFLNSGLDVPLSGAIATDPEIDAALQSDVMTVLQTDAYLPLLVQIYQSEPARRAWLLAAAEQAPIARKHAFLTVLRGSLRGAPIGGSG